MISYPARGDAKDSPARKSHVVQEDDPGLHAIETEFDPLQLFLFEVGIGRPEIRQGELENLKYGLDRRLVARVPRISIL